MTNNNRFLTAEWKNLLMLNYAVDPSLLEPFVPMGTELDAFEGKTYLSLVGFEFNRTRVLGFAVPFHQNFEEVNLRFYVRRGVVFIRELVPRYAVAMIARLAFNEDYSCVPMSHRIERGSLEYEVQHPPWRVWNAKQAGFSGTPRDSMGPRSRKSWLGNRIRPFWPKDLR